MWVRMHLLHIGSEYTISLHFGCPCAPCTVPVTRGQRQLETGIGPEDATENVFQWRSSDTAYKLNIQLDASC